MKEQLLRIAEDLRKEIRALEKAKAPRQRITALKENILEVTAIANKLQTQIPWPCAPETRAALAAEGLEHLIAEPWTHKSLRAKYGRKDV